MILLCLTVNSCNRKKEQNKDAQQIIEKKEIKNAFYEGDRIFLKLTINDSETLNLFTDTGGGRLLHKNAVDSLGIKVTATEENGTTFETANIDIYLEKNSLPKLNKALFVVPADKLFGKESNGMLGADWFREKIWTFDYQNEKLYLNDKIEWSKINEKNLVQLGFQTDSLGHKTSNFPRMPIVIEKDTIQTLFDTGATAFLDSIGKQNFEINSNIGTSFIISSIFKKWQTEHPEWKVLINADIGTGANMIEVPEVIIANHKVGPVWFTERADQNFTEYMSQWMDEKIEGAIGGSAFKYFSNITIDYNADKIYFEQ